MMQKGFKIFALFLSILLMLPACSGKQAASLPKNEFTQPVYEWGKVKGETITIWGDKDEFDRLYMARAFDNYQKQTGNIVERVYISIEEFDSDLPRIFASETAEKPDILLSYGGTNVENLNPDENFYDFTDAPWVNDLTDTALNQTIFNGKVIGLPHGEASISGTLYLKDVFKKLKLEIPKTQEEFMAACDVMLQNGITPMYLPYAEITMLLYQFPMDSFLTDSAVLDGLNDGSITYSQIPEMAKIVQWYKLMAEKGYFGEAYTQNTWDGMDTAMQSGQYGMMLCWDTWLHTNFTGDPTTIGIMPAFVGVPEEGCFEGANIVLCVVNKKSENLEAALDLISYMADPYNYNVNYAGIYSAPVFNSQSGSITTPQYMEQEKLINKLFYDSTAWSRVRGFSQVDAKYIQQYMQDECSLDECLRRMDKSRVNRVLGEKK